MKVVIALGGNALEDSQAPTAENQLKVVTQAVKHIADLIEDGHEVVISHGNGPQVGRVLIQNEAAKSLTPPLPLDLCGASTQGAIGYHIQQALQNELAKRKIEKPVASVVTMVVVDKEDPGFKNPTKPVGPFYTKEEADNLVKKDPSFVFKEDSGRGYRRVVASPKPMKIREIAAIRCLYQNRMVVVAVGGGGIPVIESSSNFVQGVAAVIDKDFASALLAKELDADMLVILTAVDQVAIDFNKPTQKNISELTLAQAKEYINQDQFAPGSMLPKVQAAMGFVESKPGRKSLITSLEKTREALMGKNGTTIVP